MLAERYPHHPKALDQALNVSGASPPADLEPLMRKQRKGKIALILDFDGTISAKDTLEYVAKACSLSRANSATDVTETPSDPPQDPHPSCPWPTHDDGASERTWSDLTSHYFTLLKTSGLPAGQVERASIARVVESGILRGALRCDLRRMGEGVGTQDGWEEFAGRLQEEKGERLHVASLNWSRDLIRGCLSRHGLEGRVEGYHTNDLEFDEGGRSTGAIEGEVILTGEDKVERLKEVLSADETSVFIGDGISDLPCILWADVGIIFNEGDKEENKVVKACQDAGFEVRRLEGSVEDHTCNPDIKPKIVYVISSWNEVVQFMWQ
ncbi:hypothetical protein HK101_007457 [Irineochytrium annulatum]|nr:hypothetical protein HK101_007457 [Irineochytrium annulatum]